MLRLRKAKMHVRKIAEEVQGVAAAAGRVLWKGVETLRDRASTMRVSSLIVASSRLLRCQAPHHRRSLQAQRQLLTTCVRGTTLYAELQSLVMLPVAFGGWHLVRNFQSNLICNGCGEIACPVVNRVRLRKSFNLTRGAVAMLLGFGAKPWSEISPRVLILPPRTGCVTYI